MSEAGKLSPVDLSDLPWRGVMHDGQLARLAELKLVSGITVTMAFPEHFAPSEPPRPPASEGPSGWDFMTALSGWFEEASKMGVNPLSLAVGVGNGCTVELSWTLHKTHPSRA